MRAPPSSSKGRRSTNKLATTTSPLSCSLGGLKEGLVVQLSNGGMALVVKEDGDSVTLDANNMLAGKSLVFELELVAIERPA